MEFLISVHCVKAHDPMTVSDCYQTEVLMSTIKTGILTAQYIDQTVRPQLLDVLWGQQIKQNQVASTSELLENPQKLTALKIKSEKFGPKFLIPR